MTKLLKRLGSCRLRRWSLPTPTAVLVVVTSSVFAEGAPGWRPFSEVSEVGYVLMTVLDGPSELLELQQQIAKNLPAPTKLVLLVNQARVDKVRKLYSQLIPSDRLILAPSDDPNLHNGLWARDIFPIPVVTNDKKFFQLIAAPYYWPFRSQSVVAASVHQPMIETGLQFVGGNLMADDDGTCFAVKSHRFYHLKPDDLKTIYGCREVHVLDQVYGIGDIDEVIRVLPDKRIVTNMLTYEPILKSWGYRVEVMPQTISPRYLGSLLVGSTAFIPKFNSGDDAIAESFYRKLGYKVVPLVSSYLFASGGTIHCHVMTYPP